MGGFRTTAQQRPSQRRSVLARRCDCACCLAVCCPAVCCPKLSGAVRAVRSGAVRAVRSEPLAVGRRPRWRARAVAEATLPVGLGSQFRLPPSSPRPILAHYVFDDFLPYWQRDDRHMHTAWSLWRRGGFSVFGARGFAGRGKPRKETRPSKLQIPTSNSSMLVPKD